MAASPGGVAIDVGTGSGRDRARAGDRRAFRPRLSAPTFRATRSPSRERNADVCRRVLRAPVEFRARLAARPLADVRARVVVSNPPYIALGEAAALPASVRDWEPAVALFSGTDGMAATARLVREAADVLEPGGLLAIEVDVRRASLVAELVSRDGAFTPFAWSWISRDASASCSPDDRRRSRMIEDKAKDLGRLIGQSNEYQAVKRASDALNEDKDTVALLQKMEQLRVDAQRMMQRGERPTEEMEKELDALLGQIQGRPTISVCSWRRRTSTRPWAR